MLCKACGWDKSQVVRTESWPEWRMRCRECLRCKYRWTTYEMSVDQLSLLEAANYVSKECSRSFKIHIKHNNASPDEA